MRRFLHIPLLCLLPLFAACEDGPPWSRADPQTATEVRPDLGPTAAYDRRLIFLGPGEALPTAAVLDFVALSDSAGLRRGVRARLVDGAEWTPIMDAGWEMEPMRDPWRLVPHGPLKVVVGEGGELASLSLRGEVDVRLEPGLTIAEHSPDAGTQLVLRQGRLTFGSDQIPGILLDVQLARAIRPRRPATSFIPVDTMIQEATPQPASTVADSLPAPATPVARAGAEALLVDNRGYHAVFATTAAGEIAWVHNAGRTDVRRDARLEVLQTERFVEADAEFPIRWRITGPAGDLTGELVAEAADRTVLDDPGGARALGYVLVTGWIEDRDARRDVYGLVRHVR